MSTTIPALDPVTDILDTDKIMVTQSSGQTYTMSGANFNKRNQAVIASNTTLTGAPLKTGNIVRVHFTADITGVNASSVLVLNYNGSNKNVKVPKDGALVNFTAQDLGGSPTVYKYLQAYTTLELLYDGTNFVIIGNPVVISNSDYAIYADGHKGVNLVTSNSIYNEDTSLNTPGWYRLATVNIQSRGCLCDIELWSNYYYQRPSSKKINIGVGWNTTNIQVINNIDEDNSITKIRTIQIGSAAERNMYIDIYYNKTQQNGVNVSLTCKQRPVTLNYFTLITETPTGVVVEKDI